MDQAATLIWILVAIIVVFLFALLAAVYKLFSLSRELQKVGKTLDALEGRLSEQERQLAAVRSALDQRGTGDMFEPLLQAFQSFKTKGWMGALTLLGSYVFRSYLGRRKQKALPKGGATEE
jgi:hypothetical protein